MEEEEKAGESGDEEEDVEVGHMGGEGLNYLDQLVPAMDQV